MVQSLLLVNVGMELAMATIVIGSLYKNPNAEFLLSDSQSSWYGKYIIFNFIVTVLYTKSPLDLFFESTYYNINR